MSSIADMGPKPVQKVTLKFYIDNKPTTELDSIFVIVNAFYGGIDTFIVHGNDSWTKGRYDLLTLELNNDGFQFKTEWIVTSFSATVFNNNKKYETGLIKYYYGNSLYKFDITQNLKDTSPLLRSAWDKYLLSLFLTLIIELFICAPFYFFTKNKSVTKKTFITIFILMNCFTHFSLWFVCSHVAIYIIFLEISVMLIETICWKIFLKKSILMSILISFLTNFGSWIIGGIIGYIIWGSI